MDTLDNYLDSFPVRVKVDGFTRAKDEMPVDKSKSVLMFGHPFTDLPRLFPTEFTENKYFTAQYETAITMRMMNAYEKNRPIIIVLYDDGVGQALAKGACAMRYHAETKDCKYILVHDKQVHQNHLAKR